MVRRIRLKVILIALAFCCVVAVLATAQSTRLPKPIMANGDSNEDSKALLDLLAESAGQDKPIIMIARLGNKESSTKLNWLRLRTAGAYLEDVRAIPKQRMILAVGEVVRGQGRIEMYLDGKLYMVFIFRRNRGFAPEG